jgi:hypothetical protein
MNPPEPNDPLDALLREKEKHIDDNGFTKRVIEALPKRRLAPIRRLLLSGALVLTLICLGIFLPVGTIVNSALSFFSAPTLSSLTALVGMAGAVFILLWNTIAFLTDD